MQQSFIDKLYR